MRSVENDDGPYDQFETKIGRTRPTASAAIGSAVLAVLSWFVTVFLFTLIAAATWELMLWTWDLVV